MKLKYLSATVILLASSSAWSHGFVGEQGATTGLKSRSLLCKEGSNVSCGPVQWEPQSLEAPKGFPQLGPADGKIASAAQVNFSALDEQTSTRWFKNPVQSGKQTIKWIFTANHLTSQFRYYMTRGDWNPNQPLTRASFDLTPFCTLDFGGKKPEKQFSHECTIPQREGYQVILAVWDVADTSNAFYNVIDVNFESNKGKTESTPSVAAEWKSVGIIQPSVDLNSGDSVTLRVFDNNGERPDLSHKILINSIAEGDKNTWAKNLADKVNVTAKNIRAGQRNGDNYDTVYGANNVYSSPESGIVRTEIQLDQSPQALSSISVTNVPNESTITSGEPLNINFTVNVTGLPLDVEATIFDGNNQQKAYVNAKSVSGSKTFTLTVPKAQAGHYSLAVVGKDAKGTVLQKTAHIMVEEKTVSEPGINKPSGNYSAIFPQNIQTYKAGTRVLQPKNGKVYECKPWPYSGYCVQWKESANAFEPGVGHSWEQAWVQVQ